MDYFPIQMDKPLYNLSHDIRFPTLLYLRPAKPQSLCKSLAYSMSVKLLTEHHLRFRSLKGGYTGLSESTLVKMPHCWKSHITAHCLVSPAGSPVCDVFLCFVTGSSMVLDCINS